MLLTAVAAGVGVATSRLLGLKDFDERALAASVRRVLGLPARDEALNPAEFPPLGRAQNLAPATAPPSAAPSAAASSAPAGAPTARPASPAPSPSPIADALGTDWISPLADNESARLAHLLRRTTFGASAADLSRAIADGYARTVDRLLETPPADPAPLAGGDTAVPGKGLNLQALRLWWVDQILASPTPFAERMTLFWHGHFASDYRKVGLQSPFVYWQNLTWRKMATADFRSMLYQVTVDPGMLRFLDLAASTGRNPNENYARELMEVFSMGADQFTEDDVKAGAKALAGWREPRTQAMVDAQIARLMQQGKPITEVPKADLVRTGVFEPTRAYVGAVTYLGKQDRFDTQAVIDRILEQDATAPYVARRVITEFVTPAPSESYVNRLAARFRATKYDVRSLLRDVFTSPEFVAESSYRALVKSPLEFMVNVARALEAPQLSRLIVESGASMGQALFDPPSVGGWPKNAGWVSSNTMVARTNFVDAALYQVKALPSVARAHEQHLDGILGPSTIALLDAARDDRHRWWAILASPEFHLK